MGYIILAIVVVLILWFVWNYNRFITIITRAKEAWADIDVQLKRRYDLIPNLVNTVKGYMTHEQKTFENISAARTAAMRAGNIEEKSKAEGELTGALKTLFAVSEAYPELKANQNFLALQNELTDTENKIQAARRFYNGNVRDLNILVDAFPSNVIAIVFRFEKMGFFELGEGEEAARQPVEVKF